MYMKIMQQTCLVLQNPKLLMTLLVIDVDANMLRTVIGFPIYAAIRLLIFFKGSVDHFDRVEFGFLKVSCRIRRTHYFRLYAKFRVAPTSSWRCLSKCHTPMFSRIQIADASLRKRG